MCVDRMEHHFVGHAIAMVVDERLKDSVNILRSIHMEWGSASQQSEGGDESHQAKAMVTMKMGDENREESIQMDSVTSKFHLRSFRTVHQEILLPDVHHHSAAVVLHCWQCTTASQNRHLEFFHLCAYILYIKGVN